MSEPQATADVRTRVVRPLTEQPLYTWRPVGQPVDVVERMGLLWRQPTNYEAQVQSPSPPSRRGVSSAPVQHFPRVDEGVAGFQLGGHRLDVELVDD